MICYMLIISMPLWIIVYLRNKWCVNLESIGMNIPLRNFACCLTDMIDGIWTQITSAADPPDVRIHVGS